MGRMLGAKFVSWYIIACAMLLPAISTVTDRTINISTSTREPTIVTSGRYTFTNVKQDLIYVFELPRSFNNFYMRVQVNMPHQTSYFGKWDTSKLKIIASGSPKMEHLDNDILRSYDYTAKDVADTLTTSRRYLIVDFKKSLNFTNSGMFLNLTLSASNAMDDVDECSGDAFKCSPSEEMCLIKDALCDGVQNCPNGFDETNCIVENLKPTMTQYRAVLEIAIGVSMSTCFIIGIAIFAALFIRKKRRTNAMYNLHDRDAEAQRQAALLLIPRDEDISNLLDRTISWLRECHKRTQERGDEIPQHIRDAMQRICGCCPEAKHLDDFLDNIQDGFVFGYLMAVFNPGEYCSKLKDDPIWHIGGTNVSNIVNQCGSLSNGEDTLRSAKPKTRLHLFLKFGKTVGVLEEMNFKMDDLYTSQKDKVKILNYLDELCRLSKQI